MHKAFEPYLQRFAAYYYNRAHQWGKEVAINYKYSAFAEGAAVYDIERGQFDGIRPALWQNDTSVSKNSWGYCGNHDYKEVSSIIGDLVDVVSKNGALLLNVGPKPDGTIPQREVEMLEEIGDWFLLNGEGIYGTRPWIVFGEGPTKVEEGDFADTKRTDFTSEDFRFTQKDGYLYCFILQWPVKHEILVTSLSSKSGLQVKSVELFGAGNAVWAQGRGGLQVSLPVKAPGKHVSTLKIGLVNP